MDGGWNPETRQAHRGTVRGQRREETSPEKAAFQGAGRWAVSAMVRVLSEEHPGFRSVSPWLMVTLTCHLSGVGSKRDTPERELWRQCWGTPSRDLPWVGAERGSGQWEGCGGHGFVSFCRIFLLWIVNSQSQEPTRGQFPSWLSGSQTQLVSTRTQVDPWPCSVG